MMVNEEIRDKEVRLIDNDGSMVGVMPPKEAQKLANAKKLDLVKIVAKAKPPVCKIMDYGKHKYELAKKEKLVKKNQKVTNVKEVRVSPKIEEHDFNFKAKHANKFLNAGNKVKVTIRFRGRQMRHTDLGKEVLVKFAEALKDIADIEQKPKLEGRNMLMVLSPKKE